jgi:inorganic pyrophosphatase
MHYPGDYGFIPGTLAEDGDPLDVLTLVQQPSFPGVMIEVRPVGVLNMMEGWGGPGEARKEFKIAETTT